MSTARHASSFVAVGSSLWFEAFCAQLRKTAPVHNVTSKWRSSATNQDVQGIVLVDMGFRSAIEAIRDFAVNYTVIACGFPWETEKAHLYGGHAFAIVLNEATISNQLVQTEIKIMRLIAKGYETKDIAATLRVREGYIKTMIKQLLQRFDAKNRAQLVAIAIRHCLI